MSDDPTLGFGKFVPGFDFLQNIAKGAGQAMPTLTNWVAPTLSVEELDKRIGELKAVHFWLEQNSKALGATIQALEVQKMTLATLKGMNFNMAEMANALTLKTAEAKPAKAAKEGDGPAKAAANGVVDPLQWWGALTQQFQQIAAGALKDVASNTAMDAARNLATGMARDAAGATGAVQAAATGAVTRSGAGKSAAGKSATKKAPRKAAARKRSAATSK
jgi:hypothetical protein